MKLSEIIVVEAASKSDVAVEEADWWFERWVHGCLGDPDWDEEWLTTVKNLPSALAVLKKKVGAKSWTGKPMWRYLTLTNEQAETMHTERLLHPRTSGQHTYGNFQSFTTSRKLALEVAEYMDEGRGVGVIVSVDVPRDLVFVGTKDMRKKGLADTVDDYIWQNEYIVLVDRPLPILTFEVVS